MATEVASLDQADGEGQADRVLRTELYIEGATCHLAFFVEGKPIAKARPRFRRDSQGRPMTYTPKTTKEWEETIAWIGRSKINSLDQRGETIKLPFEYRVMASLTFYLPRPKSMPKYRTWNVKKPDLDNLSKSVLDGIEKMGLIKNDNLVTDLVLAKRYADSSVPPGVRIELTSWLKDEAR